MNWTVAARRIARVIINIDDLEGFDDALRLIYPDPDLLHEIRLAYFLKARKIGLPPLGQLAQASYKMIHGLGDTAILSFHPTTNKP